MEPPLYDCCYLSDFVITPQPRPQPVVFANEWHHHPQHHHHTCLRSSSADHTAPRIKQEELGNFPSYPLIRHHNYQPNQPNLVSSHAHRSIPSFPYPTLLSPFQTSVAIAQQPTYYSSQSMQQHQRRRFPNLQRLQPVYHPQAYSRGTVHAAKNSCPSLPSLAGYTDQAAIAGCDPCCVSVAVTNGHRDTHSTLQQDNMKAPLSYALEGWDDHRRSSLSSLVGSELEMEHMDMDETSVMVEIDGVVGAIVGDEDTEGEDKWDGMGQQPYHLQYISEVGRSEVGDRGAYVHVGDEGDGNSFEEAESEDLEEDNDFVLKTRSSRKATVYTSHSGLSYIAGEGRSSKQRSQSTRFNPYATHSVTGLYCRGSAEQRQPQGQSSLTYDRPSIQNHKRYMSTSSTPSPSPSVASYPRSSSTTKRISGGNRWHLQSGSSPSTSPQSMIQGEKITVHGGNFTNVGGDYYENRNTTYVIEESATGLKIFKELKTTLNKVISSSEEDSTKDKDSKQTKHSNSPLRPRGSRVETRHLDDEELDASPSNQDEIHLDDSSH